MKTILIALVLGFSFLFPTAAIPSAPDVQTIIQRSVEANQRDWDAAPRFDYSEREGAADGSTRTYREMMILGSLYERLIAVDGRPVPSEQQAAEARKLENVIAERSAESPGQRAKRIAKYARERKREYLLLEQLAVAFNFTLAGEETLDAHRVYMLKATPRPDYQPPNVEAAVLTGMQAGLWIDETTFQWVRVEARVIRPIHIAGFLARVEPGTRFLLEKAPVTDTVWLPSRFTMKAKVRVLFLFSHNTQSDETYFDYQPSSQDQAVTGLLPRSRR